MGRVPLLPGDPRQIADYWLAGRLGAGGQGVVYEAYDAAGARVAVKVLHGTMSRLDKEVTATRRVASFCTARVLAVGGDGDGEGARPYLVSEYVEGPSLRQAVAGGPVFTGDDLRRLAIGIATALLAIHRAGVVHRDLKPENVLLGADGPRVIDFGIARTEDMSLTASRQVAGTPRYMAPELLHGDRAGRPADVYGWGAVVLFAATGRDPFEGEHLGYVMNQVITADPDVSVLAEPLRTLVAAALRKDPAARPTAETLLRGLLGGTGTPLDQAPPDDPSLDQAAPAGGGDLLRAGSDAAAEVRPRDAEGDPALADLAEQAYAGLDEAGRRLAPHLLLRLVSPLQQAADVLRPAGADELLHGDDPDTAERVLTAFDGLLVRQDDTVMLANAALLRAWPRLREWVDADRDGLRLHHELSNAARLWRDNGAKTADLHQGTSLDRMLERAADGRQRLPLTPVERGFLAACIAHRRTRTRRRRTLTAALAVLLLISLGAVFVVDQQRRTIAEQGETVSRQLREAVGRRLPGEAAALRAADPAVAMLLSVAAHRLAPGSREVRAGLAAALGQRELSAFTEPGADADASVYHLVDGRTLLATDLNPPHAVRVWDLETGRHTTLAADRLPKQEVTVTPDGRTLVIGNEAGVRLWDIGSGEQVGPAFGPSGAGVTIAEDLRFSRDGSVLAIDRDGVEFWDVRTRTRLFHRERGKMVVLPPAVVSADGRLAVAVLSAEQGLRLVDVRSGKTRPLPGKEHRYHPESGVHAADFSPAGRLLAATDGSSMSVTDVGTGKTVSRVASTPGLAEVRFSGDGRFVAGLTSSGLVRLWTTAEGAEVMRYRVRGQSGSLAFGAGDRTLRVLTDQSAVLTLDVSRFTHPPLAMPGAAAAGPMSDDGRLAVAWRGGGESWELNVVDVARRAPLPGVRMTATAPGVESLPVTALNADGRVLAVVVADPPSVALWDTAAGRLLGSVPAGELRGEPVWSWGLALSADGRTLAVSAFTTSRTWLWDVPAQRRVKTLDEVGGAILAFDPGARRLWAFAGFTKVVDLRTGRVEEPTQSRNAPPGPFTAFHPAGRVLAVSDPQHGQVRFRATSDLAPTGHVLNAHDDAVTALAYSPDGTVLATAGLDHRVRLWEPDTGLSLGTLTADHMGGISSVAFSPDGSRLYSIDRLGALFAHPLAGPQVAAAVCARVGRDLTDGERRRHLKEFPALEVCPGHAR
ncbi:protein kinase [Nonomuraea sp. NN258]|uniref:serine/threonine-protein kinase n=1 Tax=Nonomuraea antri TaxID=2730852 RepID=UPI0015695286|nr:serine/threonine-protein kinase [Nonomuraea antri]NRQ32790.1 protein kinase [Nonomuraea antri]